MRSSEYMPPIYILSLSDARYLGVAGGALLRKTLDRLGRRPFPVLLADPLKLGRLKIYSGFGNLAARIWVNTCQKGVSRQLIIPATARVELTRLSKAYPAGTGYHEHYLKESDRQLYESATTMLLEQSLGASYANLPHMLKRDFCCSAPPSLFPFLVPTAPETIGKKRYSQFVSDTEHLQAMLAISIGHGYKNIPTSLYWEFSVSEDEVDYYRQLFIQNNGGRVEGSVGDIQELVGDETSEELDMPNPFLDFD